MKIFSDPKMRSIEGYISMTLLFIMFLIVLLEIILTNLRMGLTWTNDASIWIWVWMIFMGFPELERTNQHLQADIIMGRFSPKIQNSVYLITDIVFFGILSHLILIAYKYVIFVWSNSPTTLTLLPMGLLYLSFFIGSILAFIRILLRITRRILYFNQVTEA